MLNIKFLMVPIKSNDLIFFLISVMLTDLSCLLPLLNI